MIGSIDGRPYLWCDLSMVGSIYCRLFYDRFY